MVSAKTVTVMDFRAHWGCSRISGAWVSGPCCGLFQPWGYSLHGLHGFQPQDLSWHPEKPLGKRTRYWWLELFMVGFSRCGAGGYGAVYGRILHMWSGGSTPWDWWPPLPLPGCMGGAVEQGLAWPGLKQGAGPGCHLFPGWKKGELSQGLILNMCVHRGLFSFLAV